MYNIFIKIILLHVFILFLFTLKHILNKLITCLVKSSYQYKQTMFGSVLILRTLKSIMKWKIYAAKQTNITYVDGNYQ